MTNFDTYADKVIPLATAIAYIKAALANGFYEKLIEQIEKDQKQKLAKDQKEIVFRAIRQFVAELSPEVFEINLDWQPSEQEARKKLEDLKNNKGLREALEKHLQRRLSSQQLQFGKT
jgi:hypothetical protein